MNTFFTAILQVAGSTPPATGSGSLFTSLIPFALIIVIFYFLILRPQNKKQKETEKMLKSLEKGDKIVTIGGIHGVIVSVKENSVVVKVDDSTRMEFSRSAISSVVGDAPVKEKAAKKIKDKDLVEENAEAVEAEVVETTDAEDSDNE